MLGTGSFKTVYAPVRACWRGRSGGPRRRGRLPARFAWELAKLRAFSRLPRSYKAFDEEDGIEVAWNQVKLRNVEEREKNALMQEVETLKRLSHPNIIRFYDSWTDSKDQSATLTVNFITELCGSNLRECAPRAGGPPRPVDWRRCAQGF